jgi:hypothetical protein
MEEAVVTSEKARIDLPLLILKSNLSSIIPGEKAGWAIRIRKMSISLTCPPPLLASKREALILLSMDPVRIKMQTATPPFQAIRWEIRIRTASTSRRNCET